MHHLPLFLFGTLLIGVVFAVALGLLARRSGGYQVTAGWLAVAFVLDSVSALVALSLGQSGEPAVFLHASLHALVPVMILAAAAMAGGAGRPLRGALPLGLGLMSLGWLGAAMTADLPQVWVLVPVHIFRAGVFAAAALLVRRAGPPLGGPLSAVCWAAALVALLATAGFATNLDPAGLAGMGSIRVVEKAVLYALGVVALVQIAGTSGAGIGRGGGRTWTGTDPADADGVQRFARIGEAVGPAALHIGADGRVVWASSSAVALFGAVSADDLIGRSCADVLPGLGERGKGPEHLPRVSAADREAGDTAWMAVRARALTHVDRPVEAARLDLPSDVDPSATAAAAAGDWLLVLRPVGPVEAGELVRLSLDLESHVLAGDPVDAICRLTCLRVVDMDGAPLVWVALRDTSGRLKLVAAGGSEAGAWKEALGHPLPTLLAEEAAAALDLASVRVLTRGIGLPERPVPPPDSAGNRLIGWEETTGTGESVGLFPLVSGETAHGLLGVHMRTRDLSGVTRRRTDVVARWLANAIRLRRETDFLRLQSAAMAVAANAIFITDRHGRIEWANEAFTRLSGFSGEEVRGKTPHLLFSGHQDPAVYADLWATISRGNVWRGELVERRKDGGLYTVQQTITPMRGPEDETVHYVAVHEDISERKRAEERIRYLSNYDMLTRLPNRTLFRDRLHQAVQQARRINGTVAVLFIDLTQFSRVNDTLGHDLGDQILMTVGSRINAAVAEEVDAFGRMGGDEFAIVQSGLSGAESAATLARRLARIIETPVEVAGQTVSLRATVGIAMYPEDGTDPDNLIKNADLAMHRVSRTEGEGYCFFSTEMNDDAKVRLGLEADLRRALERDELVNHYQPQYDMNGALVGLEALVRWNHPTRGMVAPGQFITVAEESGLIMPLGDGVMLRALSDLVAWRQAGLPLVPVAVNISAVQFRDSGLVDRIRQALEARDLAPSLLDLELTESVLMGEHAGAVTFLTRLADAGFRIAIDDFGTGYSSLSYLKRFPVHKLKIDQSFVRHMHQDSNDTILVRAIINLGHSLGMTVIAEGVETEDQARFLRDAGADVMQGYLFSRPVPADDTPTLLREARAPSLHPVSEAAS